MSKAQDLKKLLIKTTPDNPAYERIKIALEAFFGLRQEYITVLSKQYLDESGFDKAVEETVNNRINAINKLSPEEFKKRDDELSSKCKRLSDEARRKAIEDADKTIDMILTNHEGIRKLNDKINLHNDLLENLSRDQVEVEAEHDA